MKNSTKHLSSDSQLLRRVEVRPLTSEERPYWHELMGRHHYLGDCKGSGEQILYVATIGQTWIGLIGWGSAAFKSKPRDSWIGWDDPLKNRRLKFIANNFRFLLLPEYHLENMASRVLSMNFNTLIPTLIPGALLMKIFICMLFLIIACQPTPDDSQNLKSLEDLERGSYSFMEP